MTHKIVHISTTDWGGAAIAALRLHKGLIDSGVDSKFLCLSRKTKGTKELYAYRNNKSRFRGRLVNLIKSVAGGRYEKGLIGGGGAKLDIFSSPITNFLVERHPLVERADIVHLHWVSNFVNWRSFFQAVNKPIVWTLHDMNPFQGGFHYQNDFHKNKDTLGKIESEFIAIKKKAVRNYRNITVVTPSKWLSQLSQESEILGRYPHHVIPYGLDLNTFKPLNQQYSRDVLDIPKDKIIFLFVSANTSTFRKGLDLLTKALEGLNNKNVLALSVGKKPPTNQDNIHLQFLDRIEDERLMAIAYNAADAFVIPSREDNLPNTMLEALACGKPVIGFPVGGIKETIRTGVNGILTNNVTSDSLLNSLRTYLETKDHFNIEKIREEVENLYDLQIQANKYKNLYKDIIDSSR